MGGKGRRRREKNYRAAHGGNTRLPPPPKLRELEALPSKLRRIIELKNPTNTNPGHRRSRQDGGNERTKGRNASEKEKKESPKYVLSSTYMNPKLADNIDKATSTEHSNDNGVITDSSIDSARKRKRKQKAVKDLRFEELDQAASNSRKKKRKEYLKAKKNKQKKAETDDVPNFPGREVIKFGEVVEAPPKLSFPKLKNVLDASRERVRLEAIEAYRNRRGWTSRPGIQIPALGENPAA